MSDKKAKKKANKKIKLHVRFSKEAWGDKELNLKGVRYSTDRDCVKKVVDRNTTKEEVEEVLIGKKGCLAIEVINKKDEPLDLAPFFIKTKANTNSNYSLSKKKRRWKIRLGKKFWFISWRLSKIAVFFRLDWMEPACVANGEEDDTNVTIGDDNDG
jgi:hypothetical protein